MTFSRQRNNGTVLIMLVYAVLAAVIDVHSLTSEQESIFYKGGTHLNHDGARLIAEKIYRSVCKTEPGRRAHRCVKKI